MNTYNNNFNFLDNLAKNYLDINKLQDYEIKYTNLPVLLRYEDKNSMRHSIETRLPFIDYKTLESTLNINIEYKIKDGWTKYILRKVIGIGIGLLLANAITLEQLGGRVSLRHDRRGGTCARMSPRAAGRGIVNDNETSDSSNLLLVDDDAIFVGCWRRR